MLDSFLIAEHIAVHKRSLIRYLRANPEAFQGLIISFPGSLDEYIAALEADERCWLIDGKLVTSEEAERFWKEGP